MLTQLAKRDKDWRKMALHICRDKSLADDLVQDMYLKLANVNKEVNATYIYFTIKSIFLDEIKKDKEILYNFENYNEISDEYCLDYDNETQTDIDLINECLENSSLAEKVIFINTVEDGIRKFSRESNISIRTVQSYRTKFKEKVWQQKNKKG